ncbi:alpha-D-ribose 1-methylphosphonate 5-triphosphate diphosphatase [Tropicimonas isoalkanivorans]|uniref:Alpha-D-ribose 1-methylphosphonate 5-triphosphate diphosphatase n=1 Tax=Tropicimonas isoalkanivorans TaxID=441112 RepID=A0A1I1P5Z1_9RHOB|nr:alpha-D-ribose 1-methylphosphonate 5-triphosphate diphosphatase [Tropicimonas isoalkanivorans]SFD05237.1 alpha-D-ribose 1-methylphosphonate 5-triphosphate diphosphatase [Tropicimonas isoalkanivorans]
MTPTILANAQLVLPDETFRGSLKIEDGRIADIAPGTSVPADAVDCAGDLVMPGLIELHTDNLERHIRPRPKVDWPHAAAIIAHDGELASVGITTVFDAMRVGSVPRASNDYPEYARQLASELLQLRAEGALRISHYLHLRAEICSATLVPEMASFGPEDRVRIVSLMDHTPGQRQFRDMEKLKQYVQGKYEMTDAGFEDHVSEMRALRDRHGEQHERAAVAEARRYGAVLASHDDTDAAHVETSAGYGVRLAEFPTTRQAAEACRAQGISVMMGAPNLVRGGSHSGNVAALDLAQADVLDIVSSDYVPSALLSAALMLGDLWGDLPRGVRTVTRAPADAVDMPDRGRLQIGARADVIRVHRVAGAGAVRGAWVAGRRVA